jgi:ubiquinone/menaquinone biosynthesis C-methylase UbiE
MLKLRRRVRRLLRLEIKAPFGEFHPKGDIYYGDIAHNYDLKRMDDTFWENEQKAVYKFIAQISEINNILDLPVGTGRFLSIYKEIIGKNVKIYGSDASGEMLKITDKKAQKLNLSNYHGLHSDAKYLSFNENFFDVVVSTRFLLSIIDYQSTVHIIKSLVRVSKRFLIIELNWGQERRCEDSSNMQFGLSFQQLKELLNDNDLRIIEIEEVKHNPKGTWGVFLLEKVRSMEI